MEMRCGSVHLYCITLRLWIDSRQREREREKEGERERYGEIWRDKGLEMSREMQNAAHRGLNSAARAGLGNFQEKKPEDESWTVG